ncbi:MAG: hypothetical protein IMY71_10385 [Bacteroidetes bacterium]|nr:hypothetical protein [Bacteroidota bacterium]
MFDELKNYKNNGHFFFKRGNNLRDVSKDVPDLPRVYYIIRLAGGRVKLVYIGKSGSIEQDGQFNKPGLRGSLNNKQNGIKRQDYFENKFREENIDGLDIYWFVTFDKTNRDLPGYVEGLIMQIYFERHGSLPAWN